MRANIIHNPQRTEKFLSFTHEAEVQGFLFDLWPAVFAETPAAGICRAHKQIILAAKQTGKPSILVMEDDVRFSAPGAFAYYLSRIPQDYDLYFGGIYFGKVMPDGRVTQFSGTHCYICHERFYDTILSLPEKDHIDVELSVLATEPGSTIRFQVCQPFVCDQRPGWSDSRQEMVDFDSYMKNRTFYK